PLHRSWLADEADEARRTITAPELRPVGQVPCTATSTGVLIGCAYRRPMPQPSADAERIQSALLAKPARRTSDGWAFWLTLLACVLAFVLLSACTGPSEAEALNDNALNLQDAIAQAQAERRGEIHQAQALAMLAASGRK
ncbi:hypothetical protein, partial [Ottowia beijingensis]|uniref:hypothetical protein n=1 Tax=Ottowia beijingensis TaxID=1207057 RepID=UPI002FDAAF2A